jgi:hypothetical protein
VAVGEGREVDGDSVPGHFGVAVGDEEVGGVDGFEEGGEWVVLPGHEEPGGVGMGGEEGGLD